jgi:hypothetical protein
MTLRPALVSILTLVVVTTPAAAQHSSAEAEVLATTKAFLSVLETRDVEAARSLITEETRLTLLRPTQDGTGSRVLTMTGEQFIAAVTRPGGNVKEVIRNPRIEVDGDLATVWAEYQVLADGAVHHCGHDAFQLARKGGSWKVLNVSDTYSETGCGPAWE